MEKSTKQNRLLSESVKKRIAGKQYYQCANEYSNLKGLEGFDCPLWQLDGKKKGNFNEAGYEIDHKTEYSITHDDSEENLQALCTMCHIVKTKRFLTNRAKENRQIDRIYKLKEISIVPTDEQRTTYAKIVSCEIRYKNDLIGSFKTWFDFGFNTEMLINKISLKEEYYDEKLISFIVKKMVQYCEEDNKIPKSYVFNCGGIELINGSESSSLEADESISSESVEIIPKKSSKDRLLEYENKYKHLKEIFSKELLNNDKYIYFDIVKNYEHYRLTGIEIMNLVGPRYVVMHKNLINKKLKNSKTCEISLLFDIPRYKNILFHHESDPKVDPKRDENNSKMLTCKRKFLVTKTKKSNNKMIEIMFDEPIVYMSNDGSVDDIHMKFIVNGKDYTPSIKHANLFSFEYRLNKLFGSVNDPGIIGSENINMYIYSIDGFSYYENVEPSCYYPKLCKMMNEIYKDHHK